MRILLATLVLLAGAVSSYAADHSRYSVHPAAVDLIVSFEVTSRRHYEDALSRPIWPGGSSGVTWCIGYDGGHQSAQTIWRDWADHAHVTALARTSGVRGLAARDLIPSLNHIQTPWAHCLQVFAQRTLPAYAALSHRTFPDKDFLSPEAQGALVSLIYNRGSSMRGMTRTEMRVIRDVCIPQADHACVARELRRMCRLWEGTPNYRGLCRRRNAEADLALRGT